MRRSSRLQSGLPEKMEQDRRPLLCTGGQSQPAIFVGSGAVSPVDYVHRPRQTHRTDICIEISTHEGGHMLVIVACGRLPEEAHAGLGAFPALGEAEAKNIIVPCPLAEQHSVPISGPSSAKDSWGLHPFGRYSGVNQNFRWLLGKETRTVYRTCS